MNKYPYLFSEGKIGNLTLKNRTVMSGMDAVLASTDGIPGEEVIAYYTARAEGGVGMIITGLCRVDDKLAGRQSLRSLALTSDDSIPAYKQLTDAVHAYGTKIFCQLHHPGRQTYNALNGGVENVSASAKPCGFVQQPTRALTIDEIHEIEKEFAEAALRAKEGGFDGVELHCAHGYLLQQFLSPYTNLREDEYGGSFENRFRMLGETITAVKEACGKDYPVSVRLSADEFLKAIGITEQGLELEETCRAAQEMEKLGVDVINVSAANYETANCAVEPSSFPEGWRTYLIKGIKDAVSIPVMGVSAIRHPEFAEKLLAEGNQDFIVMGRTFLAEPEWVKKIEEGRENELRKCISCLHCFETYLGAIGTGTLIECALNPKTAHELQYADLKKDGNGRTVVVVGAGPGGMEAARVAALRGFKPIVFEKAPYPGGQLNYADKPPMKHRIQELIETMENQLKVADVEIRYNTEATVKTVMALEPYAVITATGGTPVKGDFLPRDEEAAIYSVPEVLLGEVDLAGKTVAVIGGGHTGLETAHHLAAKGSKVSVIEMADRLGPDMYIQNILDLSGKLAEHNVQSYVSSKVTAIEKDKVLFENVNTGEAGSVEVDAVVLSLGTKPDKTLAEALEGKVKVITIGDAVETGKIGNATRGAFDAIYNL